MKKLFLLTFFSLLAVLTVFSASTWKIGVIATLQQENGVWVKNAVDMAAKEINAAGGILGKKIELVYQDDENSAEKMKSGIMKLVTRDRIDFLIGGVGTGPVLASMDEMAMRKIIWLGTGAASPDIINFIRKDYNKYKYYFRVGTLDSSPRKIYRRVHR